MKYIIEIEEKPLCVFDKDTQTYFPRLWRVKGFNSLVFDEDGLSRLEELNSDYINEHFGDLQDEEYDKGYAQCQDDYGDALKHAKDTAYQRGLNDAWECARKLFSSMAESDIEKVFPIEWNNGGFRALINLQPQEAIAKLKAYEEKQSDKIEVGDEVNWSSDIFIVTRIYQPYGKKEQCDGIDDDGCVYHDVLMDDLEKTGRHFDIASILEDMRHD